MKVSKNVRTIAGIWVVVLLAFGTAHLAGSHALWFVLLLLSGLVSLYLAFGAKTKPKVPAKK